MAINKVIFDGTTLIDLSSDTVDAGVLASGYTAHDRSGNSITGTFTETDPIFVLSAAYGITTTDIDHWDNGYIEIDTSAVSGEDHDLYAALVANGWTDCIT